MWSVAETGGQPAHKHDLDKCSFLQPGRACDVIGDRRVPAWHGPCSRGNQSFPRTRRTRTARRLESRMLRVTQQASPTAAKSYYSSADYYRAGGELAGTWGGRGAAALGLDGVVDKAA